MTGTGEFYERLWRAGDADSENARRWDFQRALVERALDWLGDMRGRTVLEIGPGTGRESSLMIERGARVVAIDVALASLSRTRDATDGRVDAVRAAAETLPLADVSVDCVFAQTVLMHLDLDCAAAEWARVVKPGGRVVLLEPLAGNPLVGLYRRFLSPYRATHPRYVCVADLRDAHPELALARHEEHYLSSVLVAGMEGRLGRMLRTSLGAVDRVVLRVPFMRRFAWMTLAELTRA